MRPNHPAQLSLPLRGRSIPPCVNPADPSQRWYWRGRRPNWLKKYLREHAMYPVSRSTA
jgi:hypothetical protein